MAIKIIKQPPTQFTMKCEKCECLFSYTLQDLHKAICAYYVDCPCCKQELAHHKRETYTEDGE
jgi:hypothetical protein